MKSDIQELMSLKTIINSTRSADERTTNKLCLRAKNCISERMEVLVASGLVDATTFSEIDGKLENFENENFEDSRINILHLTDICLEKCEEHEQRRMAVISPGPDD